MRCGIAIERQLDSAVALDDVVPKLAEDDVVVLAAGQIVVPEAARARVTVVGGEVMEVMARVAVAEVDRVLGPPGEGVDSGAVRVAEVARYAVDEQLAAVFGGDRHATGV